VAALPAYEPARPGAVVRLDANESPYGDDGLNRYPAPDAVELHAALADYYGVATESVLATRGSDDAIDALGRAVLRPGRDSILVTPPTFAMYAQFARLQGAGVVEVPLGSSVADAWQPGVRIVYICSPNNPTGTVMPLADLDRLCGVLRGRALVVVDEAYQEFSSYASALSLLAAHDNLVVLRTLSKAFGLAGIRCGALVAAPGLVQGVRRVLPPYLLPTPVVSIATAALTPAAIATMRARVAELRARRDAFAAAVAALPGVIEVVNGEANSVLLRLDDAAAAAARLADAGIRVRAFDGQLADFLRFTIGTEQEMARAQAALR
jgi:histidinol-phosphate aminotransferase